MENNNNNEVKCSPNVEYQKNRYKTDDDFRNKKIEIAKKSYENNKEYVLSRYKTDEDFRKRKSGYSKKWYEKVKAAKTPEELAEEKAQRKAKREAKKLAKVHIIANS